MMRSTTIGTAECRVSLPVKTISEANTQDHWAKKAKRVKAQRLIACMHVKAFAGLVQLLGCPRISVTLTRVRKKGNRALDDDNLRSALKAIRDGVAEALKIDDGSDRIEWIYEQDQAAEVAVRIHIKGGS